MFLPHFDVFCDLLLNRRTPTWNLFVLYNNETNYYRYSFFNFKIFRHNVKAGLCPRPPWQTRKKPFDAICYLYKMKQSPWLLCVAKNCDWSREITPLSNLTRAPLLMEWKLTAKAELNCEIYSEIIKKMLAKSSQFSSSEQPCEPKSLDVALNIAGVEKIPLENLWLRSTWRLFYSSFQCKERQWRWKFLSSVVGDSDLKSAWYSVGDTF